MVVRDLSEYVKGDDGTIPELTFIIDGQPIVKKNTQKVVYNPRTRKRVKIDSVAYGKWHRAARTYFKALGADINFKKHKETTPTLEALVGYQVNLRCMFYMKTDGRVDMSALYEGIQDVLVEVGILTDDDFHVVAGHDGSRVVVDKMHPRMEIFITPLVG